MYATQKAVILHFVEILLRHFQIVSIVLSKHLTFITLALVNIRKTDLQKQFE